MTRPKLTIDGEKERAVSPVIGVILMVAITVILAAVIGTFVLDLGQNVQNTGPSASMGFSDHPDEYDEQDNTSQGFIQIEHQSGEDLDGDSFKITVRNTSTNGVVATYDSGDNTTHTEISSITWQLNGNQLQQSSTVTVGDVIELLITDNNAAGTVDSPDNEYSITVVSTETQNRIATGNVEVN